MSFYSLARNVEIRLLLRARVWKGIWKWLMRTGLVLTATVDGPDR
jgi:hypothetical protein